VAAQTAGSRVRLCLEPHLGNVLQEPEDFQQVFDAVPDPRVGLCVDTGHFHAAGVDTVEVIRRFATRIFNVHLKDHLGAVSVGIGRGEIDLAAIIAALREIGYRGGLTVELEVEDPENLPGIPPKHMSISAACWERSCEGKLMRVACQTYTWRCWAMPGRGR